MTTPNTPTAKPNEHAPTRETNDSGACLRCGVRMLTKGAYCSTACKARPIQPEREGAKPNEHVAHVEWLRAEADWQEKVATTERERSVAAHLRGAADAYEAVVGMVRGAVFTTGDLAERLHAAEAERDRLAGELAEMTHRANNYSNHSITLETELIELQNKWDNLAAAINDHSDDECHPKCNREGHDDACMMYPTGEEVIRRQQAKLAEVEATLLMEKNLHEGSKETIRYTMDKLTSALARVALLEEAVRPFAKEVCVSEGFKLDGRVSPPCPNHARARAALAASPSGVAEAVGKPVLDAIDKRIAEWIASSKGNDSHMARATEYGMRAIRQVVERASRGDGGR